MAKVISLRRARKQRAREAARAAGDANAERHGEAVDLRRAREAEAARADQRHEDHRRDCDDA